MRSIEVDGLTIRYADTGSGAPVLLGHCSSASNRQWSALSKRLADRYRVIVPDLIGYGESDRWPEDRPFDPEADANVLVALAKHLDGRLHLAGHSYGAAMTLEAARRLGDRVISLTLVEPVSFHLLDLAGRDAEWREVLKVARGTRAAVAAGRPRRAAAIYMGFWIGRLRWLFMPRRARATIIDTVDKVALEFGAIEEAPIGLDAYESIGAPTRLILGERTRRPARAVIEVLAELLPHVEVKQVEGAGHMSPFTHRDAVNGLIEEHVVDPIRG
jgi:pimeloyl-ACP methyl ester carboxylesterase